MSRRRGYYDPGRNPYPRKAITSAPVPVDPKRPLSRQERRRLERAAAKGDVDAARRLGIVKE